MVSNDLNDKLDLFLFIDAEFIVNLNVKLRLVYKL